MQQRDLLKDEIERLGKVLAKLVSKIMGIDSDADFDSTKEEVAQTLTDELDFDIDTFFQLEIAEYRTKLEELNLHSSHLSQLVEILNALGIKSELPTEQLAYFHRALATLDFLEEKTQRTDFAFVELRNELRAKLGQFGKSS